jgi:hypothetical protein
MHFDNYYAGKLPIPLPTRAVVKKAAELTLKCQREELSRAERQLAVDELAFEAYQLSREERLFVLDYCYGTTDLPSVLTGF